MEPNLPNLQSIFKRYITVWSRTTLFNGKSIDWDIVGHSLNNPVFVTVFPFDSKTVLLWLLSLEKNKCIAIGIWVERNESPQPDNSSDYNYRQSEFLLKYQLPTLPLERSLSRHSTINHLAEAKPSAVAYYDPPIERHGSPIPNNYEYMHRHTVNLSNYQLPNTSFVRSETRHSTINPPPITSSYPAAVYSYVDAPIERSDSPMSDYMYRQTGDQSNYQSSDHSYYRSTSYYY